jgi:hypothetical protein
MGDKDCGLLVALTRNKGSICNNKVVKSALSYLLFEKSVLCGEKLTSMNEVTIQMLIDGMSVYRCMGRPLTLSDYQRFTQLLGVKAPFEKVCVNDNEGIQAKFENISVETVTGE